MILADPSPTSHPVTVVGASHVLLGGILVACILIALVLWSAAGISRRSQG